MNAGSYGLDPQQLVRHIIRPTLQKIELWSHHAETLVLGTALVESRLRYVDQVDKANKPGPAYGLWQCEEPTHEDYWNNYLRYQEALSAKCIQLASRGNNPSVHELVFNLAYACAMCRVHYRRVKAELPTDAHGMAAYWKQYYNSPAGKGTAQKALPHFIFAINLETPQ